MEYFCALDLVTDASFFRRARACSRPKRMMRSTPARVKIAVSTATSLAVPIWTRPPAPEYSPSVFSRMHRISKPSERRGSLNARQEPVRPYIGILRKPFSDRQQQPVERYRVGHLRGPAPQRQDRSHRIFAVSRCRPAASLHPFRGSRRRTMGSLCQGETASLCGGLAAPAMPLTRYILAAMPSPIS